MNKKISLFTASFISSVLFFCSANVNAAEIKVGSKSVPTELSYDLFKNLLDKKLSFSGISHQILKKDTFLSGYTYKNIKYTDDVLQVDVMLGGYPLAHHIFVRNSALTDFRLKRLNKDFTSYATFVGELEEKDFHDYLTPILNECGLFGNYLMQAKFDWISYAYVNCSKSNSEYFISRVTSGVGVAQTLNAKVTRENEDFKGKQSYNLVVTDYLLHENGKSIQGNPFRILNKIPTPTNIVNYFFSNEYQTSDLDAKKSSLSKLLAHDVLELRNRVGNDIIESANKTLKYSTIFKGKSIKKKEGHNIKVLNSYENLYDASVLYFSSKKDKMHAFSVQTSPGLMGFKSLSEIIPVLDNDFICKTSIRDSAQRKIVAGNEVIIAHCKTTFSNDALKSSFVIVRNEKDVKVQDKDLNLGVTSSSKELEKTLDDYNFEEELEEVGNKVAENESEEDSDDIAPKANNKKNNCEEKTVLYEDSDLSKALAAEENENSSLENITLIFLAGDYTDDDVTNVVSAINILSERKWYLNLENLSELDLAYMLKNPKIKEWYYSYFDKSEEKQDSEITAKKAKKWLKFKDNAVNLFKENPTYDFNTVYEMIQTAAEEVM